MKPNYKSRHLHFASFIAFFAGLPSCGMLTVVNDTLNVEHRVFVRIPAEKPVAQDSYDPDTGWHFRHVVEGPAYNSDGRCQWYLAWHRENRGTLTRSGKLPPWGKAMALAPELADATHRVFKVYPQLIEPGAVFKQGAAKKAAFPEYSTPSLSDPPELTVGKLPNKTWPEGLRNSEGNLIPGWHLDDQHTQLAAARTAVRALPGNPGKDIRIGILDTGFDGRHHGIPARIIDEPAGDAMLYLRPEFDECDSVCQNGPLGPSKPGQTLHSGHGTGALGILASRKVRITENNKKVQPGVYELGAAPDATIVPVRVAPGPASLSTANLAYGIDYASRIKKCDVLSLSHGGSPSMMWTDAVNAAYDRGTAIFAATGDYFPVFPFLAPFPPFDRTGILVPSSSVYPAAYRRVMGVAGVTETGNSYALTDHSRYWSHFLNPAQFTGTFIRGSYGADGVRRSWLHFGDRRERENTDYSQAKRRNNLLRANPISAYSPGIPWLKANEENHSSAPSNVIDLDGGGTSAATPQAAAAAAHWLAKNRREIIESGNWNTWRKAEAAYLAMAYSASRPWQQKTTVKENQEPDVYRGCGILKAKDMLDVSYRQALGLDGRTLSRPVNINKKTGRKTERLSGNPGDIYDGDRSFFAAVFKSDRSGPQRGEEIRQRADFRYHPPTANKNSHLNSHLRNEREKAITNLYFNMLLIQQFQLGNNPVNSATEPSPHSGLKKLISVPNEAQLEADAFQRATGRKLPPRP